VFLLGRPLVLRWTLAVVLVLAAIYVDLRPPSTVDHPYAAFDLDAGDAIDRSSVLWRSVPKGLFEPVDLPASAGRQINRGQPILMADIDTRNVDVPDGWLVVEVPVPQGSVSGGAVVAIVAHFDAEPVSHPGVIVSTQDDRCSCAFPTDAAAEIAIALTENRVQILLGSSE